MITLTISSSLPQFTQFLLERCGIEGNILTVDEARAAARHGSTWNDVVGVWKKRCPLEPEDESFVKLLTTSPRSRRAKEGVARGSAAGGAEGAAAAGHAAEVGRAQQPRTGWHAQHA